MHKTPQILACAAAVFGAHAAHATTPVADILCKPTNQLVQTLNRQFGVERAARGTQGPDQIMEVWTDGSGDWTMVVTYATGTSCVVAMGKNWDRVQAENPA